MLDRGAGKGRDAWENTDPETRGGAPNATILSPSLGRKESCPLRALHVALFVLSHPPHRKSNRIE